MIKLQGNAKIQGKAMFGIEPEVIAFSPEQITGLKGWYDYTYGVFSTSVDPAQINLQLARWANKVGSIENSGTNGHLVQPTFSLQPIYKADGVQFIEDAMFANFGSNISAARTYYIILKKPTGGFFQSILSSNPGPPATARRNSLVFSPTNGGRFALSQGTTVATLSPYNDNNNFLILNASFDGVGTGRIRINNGLNTDEQITNIGNNFEASPILYLGATSGILSTSRVKEILFFEGAHTSEQKTQVINYLNAKHNVF